MVASSITHLIGLCELPSGIGAPDTSKRDVASPLLGDLLEGLRELVGGVVEEPEHHDALVLHKLVDLFDCRDLPGVLPDVPLGEVRQGIYCPVSLMIKRGKTGNR